MLLAISTIEPVRLQAPVPGSEISALAKPPASPKPPVTSTELSASSVALWPWRPLIIEPVTDQVPVAGS